MEPITFRIPRPSPFQPLWIHRATTSGEYVKWSWVTHDAATWAAWLEVA